MQWINEPKKQQKWQNNLSRKTINLAIFDITFMSKPCAVDAVMKRKIAELGFMAMHTLGEKDKNFIASPVSAFAVLGMCPSLFVGETRRELEKALGLSSGESNESFSGRVRALLDSEEDDRFSLYCRVVCNQQIIKCAPGAFDVFRDVLGTPAIVCDFPEPAKTLVNHEAAKLTYGEIEKVISDLSEDAVMLLVNVAFFQSEWLDDRSSDLGLIWHLNGEEKLIPGFNVCTENTYFGEVDGFKFVSMLYVGSHLKKTDKCNRRELLMVLPPADRAFDPTMLSVDFFLANIPKERANVEITIPKWHIKENDLKLQSMCESLGIHKMFTLHADTVASGQLTRSYHISDFYQKTNILVNGEGTRASVVSVMEGVMPMGMDLDPIPSVEFRADRPFFYAIYNRRNGVIDFIGYLVDPEYDGEDNFTDCTTVTHRFEEKDDLYG